MSRNNCKGEALVAAPEILHHRFALHLGQLIMHFQTALFFYDERCVDTELL